MDKSKNSNNKKPSIVYAKEGQIVYSELDYPNNKFFIIKKGTIKSYNIREVVFYKEYLTVGDIFGIIECISKKDRLTTCIALTDCELIEIDFKSIQYYITNHPNLAKKLIKVFSIIYRKLRYGLQENILTMGNGESLYNLGFYYLEKNEPYKAFYVFYKYLKNFNDTELTETAKYHVKKLKRFYKYIDNKADSHRLVKSYKKGTFIFTENEPIEEFYVIKKGKVKITKFIDNKEVTLAIIDSGFVIGEMSILNKEPKSANAITIEDTECIVINKDNFDKIFSLHPRIAKIVLNKYCIDLWNMIRKEELSRIIDLKQKVIDTLYYEYQIKDLDKTDFTKYKFDLNIRELFAKCGIVDESDKKEVMSILSSKLLNIRNNEIYLISKYYLKNLKESYNKNNIKLKLTQTLTEIGSNLID